MTALPLPVQNLRKIWNLKKNEIHFTQVEASKQLAWSQGAISHYLNNITELGPAAVIKFANFLNVDPTDIDPDVSDNLSHYKSYEIRADLETNPKDESTLSPFTPIGHKKLTYTNSSKYLNEQRLFERKTYNLQAKSMFSQLMHPTKIVGTNAWAKSPGCFFTTYVQVTDFKHLPDPKLVMIWANNGSADVEGYITTYAYYKHNQPDTKHKCVPVAAILHYA